MQVQDFIDDPLTFKGSMRVRSATELVRGFADIWEHRGGLRMPLYAQHGNADKITSCKVNASAWGCLCKHNTAWAQMVLQPSMVLHTRVQ